MPGQKGQKRPRLDQILNDLDEIGERKPSSSFFDDVAEPSSSQCRSESELSRQMPSSGSPTTMTAAGRSAAAPRAQKAIAKPQRNVSSDNNSSCPKSPATPSDISDRVFSSELDRHNRLTEDCVDMALFLAQTYAASATSTALLALVRHLQSNGAQKVVNAVKRAGHLKQFVTSLLTPRSDRPGTRGDVAFLRFFRLLAEIVPTEVLCNKPIFERVLRALDPSRAGSDASATAPVQAAPVHWSQRFKPIAAAAPANDPADGELELALSGGPATSADDTTTSTCVDILLKLVFNQNQAADASFGTVLGRSNSQLHGSDDGATLLYRQGGFQTLAQVLRRDSTSPAERVKILQLLDVVTCSGSDLSHEPAAESCFEEMLRTTLLPIVYRRGGDSPDDEFGAALRVCINITSLFPSSAVSQADEAPKAATPLLTLLMQSAPDDSPLADYHVYCLCLLVNMLRRGKNTRFCNAVVAQDTFLAFAAAEIRRLHASDDAESNVTAGYYATLLGMLSLSSQEARVRVKHALQTARTSVHEESPASSAPSQNPLKFVLAVLQEFVLFQSSAGILTKEALIGMHQLVQSLVDANSDIVVEVSPAAPGAL